MTQKAPSGHTHHNQFGGQAVIEGVMMRGPKHYAVACRRTNNEIVVKKEPVKTIMDRVKWLNKPFLRGTLVLIDSIILGMKTLMFSANIQLQDADVDTDNTKTQDEQNKVAASQTDPVNDIRITGSMAIGLIAGILIFIALPNLLTNLLHKSIQNPFAMNIIEGLVKIVIFFAYVYFVSKMQDIQRVFMYHGAEHKVINTYESGLDLTMENISKFGTIHSRCGTSFIMVVLILSIFVHFFVGWSSIWYIRIIARILLVPVIAGIAYEVIKFAGNHTDSKMLMTLLMPGMLMQRITTKEPTEDQIEVALTALNAVIESEQEALPA